MGDRIGLLSINPIKIVAYIAQTGQVYKVRSTNMGQ